MSTEQEQVQVRFVTKQPQYAVQDAAILVPVDFKRYGLSEIINNLLGLDKPIPFEFLIDGEILRSSITDYLTSQQLSTENLITIEYMESMLPPTPLTSFQHDDWISSVNGCESLFLTGSYDNMVRLWNSSGECINTLIGHTEAVKSVAFGPTTGSSTLIFSAGLDHTAIAWQISETGEEELLYECLGHQSAIESLAVNASKSHFATASADSMIKVWKSDVPDEDEPTMADSAPKKKKRTEKKAHLTKTQAVTLNGHVGAVNAVDFDSVDTNTVYSGGWDHSIRSWDIEQQVNVTTKVKQRESSVQ
ncbi:WD40-repeat-containing domain protein [Chlamydoabsidia padenii]|nr:WD40-repeat-containing domain protein [Chlamydoabsidia padenii]